MQGEERREERREVRREEERRGEKRREEERTKRGNVNNRNCVASMILSEGEKAGRRKITLRESKHSSSKGTRKEVIKN